MTDNINGNKKLRSEILVKRVVIHIEKECFIKARRSAAWLNTGVDAWGTGWVCHWVIAMVMRSDVVNRRLMSKHVTIIEDGMLLMVILVAIISISVHHAATWLKKR